MYPYISLDEINPQSPDAYQKLNEYYRVHLDSMSFVLDQACELIESECLPNDENNTAIALKMMTSLGKRMEGVMVAS